MRQKPLLVNSNENEAGFYRIIGYSSNVSLTNEQWSEFNAAAFSCPSYDTARDRVLHGVPTWQSRYFGDWANLRLYPTSGAYHGSEVPLLFGTAGLISGIPNDDPESQVAHYISSAWVAFAADPKNGLTAFGWPRYNTHGKYPSFSTVMISSNPVVDKSLVGLGYQNQTRVLLDPCWTHLCCELYSAKDISVLGTGAI